MNYAKMTVIGAANKGTPHHLMDHGPGFFRKMGVISRLESQGITIQDLGDVTNEQFSYDQPSLSAEQEAYNNCLAQFVSLQAKSKQNPLLIIGGEKSSLVGSHRGFKKIYGNDFRTYCFSKSLREDEISDLRLEGIYVFTDFGQLDQLWFDPKSFYLFGLDMDFLSQSQLYQTLKKHIQSLLNSQQLVGLDLIEGGALHKIEPSELSIGQNLDDLLDVFGEKRELSENDLKQ